MNLPIPSPTPRDSDHDSQDPDSDPCLGIIDLGYYCTRAVATADLVTATTGTG